MFMTDFSCYISKQSVINIKTLQWDFTREADWTFLYLFEQILQAGWPNSQKKICNAIRGNKCIWVYARRRGLPLIHTVQCLNAAYSIKLHFLQFSNFCQLTQCLPSAALGHSTFGGHHPAPCALFQRHLSLRLPQTHRFQFTLIYSALKPKL